MVSSTPIAAPTPRETRIGILFLVLAFAFNLWGVSVGWESKNLPGVEFRQAQTALSAYFIQKDGDFSVAYPTPVLGKPWSVPMEFPWYQWTVVVVSDATGLGITKAGRLVSIACLYLTLPALFLLLGQWGVARGRRWPVLALVLTCPLYVFYGRAVLIETMALMFAVWFWAAFAATLETRKTGWLVLANLTGVAAGLGKVTTLFVVLLPIALESGRQLWTGRREQRWKNDLAWIAGAAVVPLAAAGWWVIYSDAIKARNPMADFLISGNLEGFNVGSWADHFSAHWWSMRWRIIRDELTWLPLLAPWLAVAWFAGKSRAGSAAVAAIAFATPIIAFPILYGYHDYYYVANTVMLWLAVGLLAIGCLEQPRWRVAGWSLMALMVVGQAARYVIHDYPIQHPVSFGGSGLTEAVRAFTRPDDVIVIAGEDWNSMIPFYSRRRALMLRADAEADLDKVDAGLRELDGERIGALVVTGDWRARKEIIWRLGERGLAVQPWLHWHDSWIFLRADLRADFVRQLPTMVYDKVSTAEPASLEPGKLGGGWHSVASMPPDKRSLFGTFSPSPERYYNTFEPVLEDFEGQKQFGAHPWTRLVFRLPKGSHVLRFGVAFNSGAYQVPPGQNPTDGVEITLNRLGTGRERTALYSRIVNPTATIAERGLVPIEARFSLEDEGEVELVFGPGPNNQDTRDWIYIRGPLRFD
ncbi:MAG TPA: hypothetical protein VHD32_02610 [Candidatus Didemnitutus sp.]|nr:hypothetical protein [Candidatus Didemnitutus sp.]